MESSGGLDFCVIFARRPSTAVRVVGSTGPEVLVRTRRKWRAGGGDGGLQEEGGGQVVGEVKEDRNTI